MRGDAVDLGDALLAHLVEERLQAPAGSSVAVASGSEAIAGISSGESPGSGRRESKAREASLAIGTDLQHEQPLVHGMAEPIDDARSIEIEPAGLVLVDRIKARAGRPIRLRLLQCVAAQAPRTADGRASPIRGCVRRRRRGRSIAGDNASPAAAGANPASRSNRRSAVGVRAGSKVCGELGYFPQRKRRYRAGFAAGSGRSSPARRGAPAPARAARSAFRGSACCEARPSSAFWQMARNRSSSTPRKQPLLKVFLAELAGVIVAQRRARSGRPA